MSALLHLSNIHKRYGANVILEEATATFSKNQKIGVIGRNGAGKSTLCKIIIGQEEMDEGEISRNSELRLNYLEQHDPFKETETVLEFLTRYTGKEEWECAEMAGKFQLKNESLEHKISALAGGYRTRVKLTAMLLGDPNFLILDEPTNYLDLSTLILLENFLQRFNGGFLIVSHDREFLKRTCDHTLEVEDGRLVLYPGDIEEYFEFKETQRTHKVAHNKTVEKKQAQLQEFIDRFRAKASTASRAKSKMKQLARLKTIEIAHHTGNIRIRIPPVERKAGIALFCDHLAVGYPEKRVAEKINLQIDRGARVAVLGDNGQGKTTFLKTIAGDLKPKAGSYRWGTGLEVAYYAQHVLAMLHPEDEVFTHLQREAAEGVTTQDILNMAGCFLFKGDDVRKKVSVLSGGEKARLSLAGLLLKKSHALLLDEPTNHLDFETVEALGTALHRYTGTLFFISHDRTFVNLVATEILEVKDGRINRYPGSYEDFVYYLEVRAREEFSEGHSKPDQSDFEVTPNSEAGTVRDVQEDKKAPEEKSDYLDRKKRKSEISKIQNEMTKSERRLEHFTEERDHLLAEIKKNPFHYSKPRNEKLKALTISIEHEEAEWLRLQTALEQLEKG